MAADSDAPPPSYDAVASTSTAHVANDSKGYTAEKTALSGPGPSSTRSPPHTPKPSFSRATFSSPLFGLLPSKAAREARTTVKALIQDIIVLQSPPEACRGILQSCADSCKAYDLPLHSILQERYMEEHTPLYWAIVKRAEEHGHGDKPPAEDDPGDIPMILLALAAPLTADTIADIRQACVVFSDNALFQRLRMAPEFASLSSSEQILFNGEAMIPDSVTVEDVRGEGAFVAHMRIPKFQRRMRVASSIALEFIALGTIWRIVFLITPQNVRRRHPQRPGSWCLSLSLMDDSSPTYFNGRLIVPDARRTPGVRPKADLAVVLKSDEELVPMTRFRSRRRNDEILVELEESVSSLQFSGTPYIHEDDTLVAHLEAKLAKPDDYECIIC
ncbi:hypothetical protein HDZ31DRAFT_38376 [Schizophyllum fasciatum]